MFLSGVFWPFAIVGGKIKVCFCDFANKRAIDQVRLLFMNKGLVMERYLTFEENIMRVLIQFGKNLNLKNLIQIF